VRVLGYSPDSIEVSTEAEESPLLEAVTRERLVKTQQTEKTSVCLLIYKVWRSVMVLQLSVVTSRVLK
jgi:hypothetical protein